MIGQKHLLYYIEQLHSIPHFIVLVAPKGHGKRTMAKYIAMKLHAQYAPCGVKVDEVREVINTAMTVKDRVVYCFEDADEMRQEAKNAMLKITEEPPESAYFIMTVCDDSSMLDTIKSRAAVWALQPYRQSEIEEMYDIIWGDDEGDKELMCDIAGCYGELQLLKQYGQDFIDYVNLVIDNIAEVEPANAFKSSQKLSFKKDETDKYDLTLFFDTFINLCYRRIDEVGEKRFDLAIDVTCFYRRKAAKVGANLQQVYDGWVFDLRKVWIE